MSFTKATHYFGKKLDGKRGRFSPGFTDHEFNKAVEKIGGTLPSGWCAWHFNQGEDIGNSNRVKAFAKLAEIQVRHWSGMFYSASREQVVEQLIGDSLESKI